MVLEVTGALWYWRGPAPWYFVTVPDEESGALREVAAGVTYGWGMVPVMATIGDTTWTTSLWPQQNRYVIPVKAAVRRSERLAEGDLVTVRLSL